MPIFLFPPRVQSTLTRYALPILIRAIRFVYFYEKQEHLKQRIGDVNFIICLDSGQ